MTIKFSAQFLAAASILAFLALGLYVAVTAPAGAIAIRIATPLGFLTGVVFNHNIRRV